MSKYPRIHYIKDKNNLIKAYYLALIPLFFFGFYKNGILLYQNGLISFIDIFIPLYYPLISIITAIMIALITKESKKILILISLIISCSISINTNMLLYPLILFAALFVTKIISQKYAFNYISLTRGILVLALLLNSYSYLNVAEKIEAFNYNLLDIFWGHSSSGIFTSSLFFLVISFGILAFNKYYKKIIPLMASIMYSLIFFMIFLITKNMFYIESILSGTVYFGFVFVATFQWTPNTKRGMAIYGLIIGILTPLIALIIPIYEASFWGIFVASLFIPLINKLVLKKDLQ